MSLIGEYFVLGVIKWHVHCNKIEKPPWFFGHQSRAIGGQVNSEVLSEEGAGPSRDRIEVKNPASRAMNRAKDRAG